MATEHVAGRALNDPGRLLKMYVCMTWESGGEGRGGGSEEGCPYGIEDDDVMCVMFSSRIATTLQRSK